MADHVVRPHREVGLAGRVLQPAGAASAMYGRLVSGGDRSSRYTHRRAVWLVPFEDSSREPMSSRSDQAFYVCRSGTVLNYDTLINVDLCRSVVSQRSQVPVQVPAQVPTQSPVPILSHRAGAFCFGCNLFERDPRIATQNPNQMV